MVDRPEARRPPPKPDAPLDSWHRKYICRHPAVPRYGNPGASIGIANLPLKMFNLHFPIWGPLAGYA